MTIKWKLEEEEEDEDKIPDNDGRSADSLCRLLQRHKNLRVLHLYASMTSWAFNSRDDDQFQRAVKEDNYKDRDFESPFDIWRKFAEML